jgi:hypothetical protein
MELIGLAVIAVFVSWKLGLFDMADEAVEMGKAEVREARRDQKQRLVKKASARTITEDEYKTALGNNALLDSYDL